MAIEVTTIDDSITTFRDALAYHVDDNGYLHIRGSGAGNLATFHAHRWQGVAKIETESK